jgi:hypothetical protein
MRLANYKVILFTLAVCVSCAKAQQADTMTYKQVTLPQTEIRYIYSSIIGEEIKIFVSLPENYRLTDTTYYPVLYLTDANLMFAAINQIIRMMQIGMELPQLILVGLGYKTDNLSAVFKLRSGDLTPTPIPDPQKLGWPTGGAPRFIRFMREELFPFIGCRGMRDMPVIRTEVSSGSMHFSTNPKCSRGISSEVRPSGSTVLSRLSMKRSMQPDIRISPRGCSCRSGDSNHVLTPRPRRLRM